MLDSPHRIRESSMDQQHSQIRWHTEWVCFLDDVPLWNPVQLDSRRCVVLHMRTNCPPPPVSGIHPQTPARGIPMVSDTTQAHPRCLSVGRLSLYTMRYTVVKLIGERKIEGLLQRSTVNIWLPRLGKFARIGVTLGFIVGI